MAMIICGHSNASPVIGPFDDLSPLFFTPLLAKK